MIDHMPWQLLLGYVVEYTHIGLLSIFFSQMTNFVRVVYETMILELNMCLFNDNINREIN